MSHPRRRLSVSAALIAAAVIVVPMTGTARQTPASPQRPTFASDTEAWWVTATVVGADGHLMTDLTKDDFEVRDNGEVRPITAFRSDRIPFAIVPMFDLSNSMADNLGIMRRAMGELFKRFEPGDRANIGHFDSLPYIGPRFTGNATTLLSWVSATMANADTLCEGPYLTDGVMSLHDRLAVNGFSAVWDAVDCAITAVASDSETPRRVVLLVTDGMDNVSVDTADDVTRQADEDGVMIYGIVMNGGDPGGTNPFAIKSMAEETGGGYFILPQMNDMSATFARVGEELRHQYVFGFSPSGGAKHSIEIKSSRPGSTTRSRRVYLTPNPLGTSRSAHPPDVAAKTVTVAVPTIAAAPLRPGDIPANGVSGLLDHFELGDWSMFLAPPPTPANLQTMQKWFETNGATWAAAAGPANERRRRLTVAAFILQLLNTEEDPLLWFGGGSPTTRGQDPSKGWPVAQLGLPRLYDSPLPATRLLQWAAGFLKAEPALLAERWWHVGAIALLEREHATAALQVETDAAHARFPSEDRYVLARAMTQEAFTWPQVRDGRDLLVPADQYRAIADRYTEASARESVKPEAELRMGFLELRRGHADTALSHFARAGTPADSDLRYWLGLFQGQALESTGRMEDAIASYRRAFTAAPYAQSAVLGLAAALERAHHESEAAELVDRALKQQPAPFDPWSIYTFPDIRFWPRVTTELRTAVTVSQ